MASRRRRAPSSTARSTTSGCLERFARRPFGSEERGGVVCNASHADLRFGSLARAEQGPRARAALGELCGREGAVRSLPFR